MPTVTPSSSFLFALPMWLAFVSACHSGAQPVGVCPVVPPPPSSAPVALAPPALSAIPLFVPDPSAAFHVTLGVDPDVVARIDELHVIVVLTNVTSRSVRLRTAFLEAGTLDLEVRDSSGEAIHGGPPPTPTADDGIHGWETVNAGSSVTVHCDTGIMVDVPAGRYEVRFRGVPGDITNPKVESAWVPFTVTQSVK
jgi:hypothetical protein